MKSIPPFLLSFFLLTAVFAQNNTLRGIVKLQSSGSKSLANVKISAFGASPGYSNSSGMFELSFSTKQPGSSISLIIEKAGYELINEKELENCVLRERADELLIVVMAKEGERNKQALAYYNIILETTNNNYQTELNEIKNKIHSLDEDDKDRRALIKQIADLQDEKKKLLDRAEDLAKQMSIVDLDQASEMAQAAYEKFQSGEIKAALEILNDEALEKNYTTAKNEKIKLEERLLSANSAFQQSIENYMIKARFCISDRQYDEAYDNYLKGVNADSTNVDNLTELANYCGNLKQQGKAILYFRKALNNTISDATKADLLTSLGSQLLWNNDLQEANLVLLEALSIREALAKENQKRYERDVAHTLGALAVMHFHSKEYDKAKDKYLASLEIYRRLTKANPNKYDPEMAVVLMNFGGTYWELKELDMAISVYSESLEIRKRLLPKNPQRFEPEVAYSGMNLAVIYQDLEKYELAETTYLDALQVFKRLARENPSRYETYVALTNLNLGNMYLHLEEFEKAEIKLLESTKIKRQLANLNPRRHESVFASSLNTLGKSHRALNKFEEAEIIFQECLEIYERLASANPKQYNRKLCRPLVGMADLKKSHLERTGNLRFRGEGLQLIIRLKELLTTCNPEHPEIQEYQQAIIDMEKYFTTFSTDDD